MPYATAYRVKLANHLFMNAALAQLSTIYLGVSTASPGLDGAGLAEPVGGAYARVATTAGDWTVDAAGAITNANTETFPQATAGWGSLTYAVIFDAPTGGSILAYGALTVAKTINNLDTCRFPAGELDLVWTGT